MKTIPIRHISAVDESRITLGRFSIRKIRDILNGKDLQHDLHRHDFYFILLLQSGEGVHEIDFIPYKVIDKSVFLLRPGQVHQLYLKSGGSGYLMEFDNEFFHPTEKASAQRLRRAGSINLWQPAVHQFEKLHVILQNLFDEFSHQQEGYRDAIKAGLELFYIELLRQNIEYKSHPIGNSYTQERFVEFTDLLEKNVSTHKQVSQYTDLMNLSPYQLNEITKKNVGKTASELIDEYILLEAKRYLLATSNQVKEVADQLGFEDPSYFIRFFKKHTGLAPDTFRKNFT